MHHALASADRLHMIFVNLDQRSLSRLALTCRLFNGIATPVLWSELDSLLPLWKLLPSEVVSIEAVEGRSSFVLNTVRTSTESVHYCDPHLTASRGRARARKTCLL
jgi:hypothetical protein